jgi:membrane-bound metal-dependent hydrolase YbcI (DUF457 family)
MTGPTHRQYSICFAALTIMLLYMIGMTTLSLTEGVNYYFTIPIILMSAKSGALFPDVDHYWENVHDKTVVNKIINVIIHATGGKHRSWQTHSIDICTVFTTASCIVPNEMYKRGLMSDVNKQIITILLLGFASGWISHLFSDMLTSAGVKVFFFLKFKIKLVPKKIFNFRFNTGGDWEKFNFKVVRLINIILGICCLAYPVLSEYILN